MSKIIVDDLKLTFTPVEEISSKINLLKKGFSSHKTKNLSFRKEQLKKLKSGFEKYIKEVHRSNYLDLGINEYNSFYYTTSIVSADIDYIIDNFESWTKPRNVDTSILFAPCSSYLLPEPYGVVVIFSAWNFQWQTLLQPIAVALASGNVVLAKPSEMAAYSAKMVEIVCGELDPEVFQIVQGGADQCIALNNIKTDLIVFTGSPFKGKIVAKAAAEFLTPCILELGGQNPVIVDETADINSAVTNIVSARFINVGQICIGPEYVFVHKSKLNEFLLECKEKTLEFYSNDPKTNIEYSRVINEFHSERLSKLISDCKGKIVVKGGECSVKDKFIPPTIFHFENISQMEESNLAKDEIFGPILYITEYTDINDCIEYINRKEKPLAMYYFGFNKKNKADIISKTSSGGLVFNDATVQFASHYLPFGGVGQSGYGAYHGKYGFDAFSHLKPIMDRDYKIIPLRYPPFTKTKQHLMKKLLLMSKFTQKGLMRGIVILVLLISIFVFRSNFSSGFHGFVNPYKKQ